MTVINQNSISGITSITAASGSVQIFNSDGSSGSLTDLAGINVVGVVTATSFSGDGSSLTGIGAGSSISLLNTNVTVTDTGSNGTITFTTDGNTALTLESDQDASFDGRIFVKSNTTTGVVAGSAYLALNYNTTNKAFITSYDASSNLDDLTIDGDNIKFRVGSFSEAARIDSSGHLLVGGTTAGNAATRTVSIGSPGTTTGGLQLWSTTSGASYVQFGDATGSASDHYRGLVGYEHNNDALIFFSAATERLRIDSSGRLLLGTTTEGHPNADDFTIAGSGHAGITIRSGTTSVGGIFFSDATTGSGEYDGAIEYNQNTQELTLYTAATDRMRIDASGRVMIGTSSVVHSGAFLNIRVNDVNSQGTAYGTTSTSGRVMVSFNNPNGEVGYIVTSGTTTGYNTSSDYRLKENVVDLDGAITRIKQLQPSRFNFIADPNKTVDGFIAHEVQDVVPEAIFGEKDAVDDEGNPKYQGIDQSKLVPLLTAALQEAIGKIETLETEKAEILARLDAAGI